MSAADETDGARYDRDGPVAKLFDVNGKFVGKLVYFPTSSVEPIAPGGVVLNINGALVYAPIIQIGKWTETKSSTELRWYDGYVLLSGSRLLGRGLHR